MKGCDDENETGGNDPAFIYEEYVSMKMTHDDDDHDDENGDWFIFFNLLDSFPNQHDCMGGYKINNDDNNDEQQKDGQKLKSDDYDYDFVH